MTSGHRPPRVVRWLACAERLLRQAAPRLDALNVFPVPDADTGVNMHATLVAAHAAAAADPAAATDIGATLERAGSAALSAARGNSGTVLAVLLTGMADPLRGKHALTAESLAQALTRADTAARSAVSDPREGTILSVLAAARTSALHTLEQAAQYGPAPQTRAVLEEAVTACVRTARIAVQRTETQLEALRHAAVVDAGAVGLLLVFEALRAVVVDEEPDPALTEGLHGYADGVSAAPPAAEAQEGGVEVLCTLELDPLGAATLRQQLTDVGDSVIVAPVRRGEDPQAAVPWRVHVHVPAADPVLELLHAAATPQELQVTALCAEPHRTDRPDHAHGHERH